MDNDILIDQARRLYALLQVKQINTLGLERLYSLSVRAYRRYQRRLNRCAICYRNRNYDCIREPGKKLIPCPRRPQFKKQMVG
jgi:hypothetical protein